MEAEDWETSSEGMSDTEVNLQNEDDEEYCYTSSFMSKLQFRKEISRARWNDEMGMAEVVEHKGRMWTTTGIVRNGKIYCFIEETLFLAEVGALIFLNDDDTPLSLKDIYERVAKGKYGCCWETFEVYKHLKSLGYIVGRHGIPWSMKSVKSFSDSVSLQGTLGSNGILERSLEEETSLIKLFNSMHIHEVRLLFDVYLPNSKFRKSSPGNPSFVLCSTRDYPPSKSEIEALERCSNGIPLKFGQVEHGRVSYFSFDKVELPVLL